MEEKEAVRMREYHKISTVFKRDPDNNRKGATSAREGQIGIIPSDMGSASYIVRGLGNPDSFNSCSHGAGRTMSRAEANRTLSQKDVDKKMEGIIHGGWEGRSRKGKAVIDLSEAPGAYKDITEVMKNQEDLVEIVDELRPIVSIKG